MTAPTIIFAGGGTGGHIYPNIAIYEALQKYNPQIQPLFLVSQRSTDKQILEDASLPFIQLPAQPLRPGAAGIIKFAKGYLRAKAQVKKILAGNKNITAAIATGGFVAAPIVAAAQNKKIPIALVNLDAVPGKANKQIAKKADKIFSVHKTETLAGAQVIGMPLRQAAQSNLNSKQAKKTLEFNEDAPLLFITAGSLGADTINSMMAALCKSAAAAQILKGWQVLHICGRKDDGDINVLQSAYELAGINAKVFPFCNTMGDAWAAADLAISRAGASSVAEIQAACVPAIFFPYPHHKDQHQRKNALPLQQAGGAEILEDLIDASKNVAQIETVLSKLTTDKNQLEKMRTNLKAIHPISGSEEVAKWILGLWVMNYDV